MRGNLWGKANQLRKLTDVLYEHMGVIITMGKPLTCVGCRLRVRVFYTLPLAYTPTLRHKRGYNATVKGLYGATDGTLLSYLVWGTFKLILGSLFPLVNTAKSLHSTYVDCRVCSRVETPVEHTGGNYSVNVVLKGVIVRIYRISD